MINRFATAAFAAAALLLSQSVSAQTPAPAQTSASGSKSMLDDVTISVAGGVSFTKKTGGVVDGEIVSKEYRKNMAFSLEGGWMSNVVSAHRLDSAAAIANYLTQTQGQPASATVKKVPAGYGAVNVRYTVMTKPRYRVYALAGGGFGVTSPKTTFTLGGTDVTGSVSQYGVTLGKDLTGSSVGGLVNVGLGATAPHGKWVGDASYRLTPMFTKGGTTVVNRLNFGVGYKF